MSAALIAERAKTHGDFTVTARIAQHLKRAIADELPGRERRDLAPLSDEQLEAVDMILTKIARIVAGDSNHGDHWRDISGYALLGIEFDQEVDAAGSFDDAIATLRGRAKAGEEIPSTGYFEARRATRVPQS